MEKEGKMNRWDEIKKKGSSHYKGGKVEPIDLYKEGGFLWSWCIGEIIAKAYRSRLTEGDLDINKVKVDMNKIIHHAEMIISLIEEEELPS
jgi:uncharacterized protein YkwD